MKTAVNREVSQMRETAMIMGVLEMFKNSAASRHDDDRKKPENLLDILRAAPRKSVKFTK